MWGRVPFFTGAGSVPARPLWSVERDLECLVVVLATRSCPETAQRGELPWVRPPGVYLLLGLSGAGPP
eukprot:4792768-Pyramimonas_sp.AAC.1